MRPAFSLITRPRTERARDDLHRLNETVDTTYSSPTLSESGAHNATLTQTRQTALTIVTLNSFVCFYFRSRSKGSGAPPLTIVTDQALKGFDEILESDLTPKNDWLSSGPMINYQEKINFSDEEDEPSTPRDLNKQSARSDRPSADKENMTVTRHGDSYVTSALTDEAEWIEDQRRKQEREMADAVARARARRYEEEQQYEMSRRAAQEKAKLLAKKDSDKESTPTSDTKTSAAKRDHRGDERRGSEEKPKLILKKEPQEKFESHDVKPEDKQRRDQRHEGGARARHHDDDERQFDQNRRNQEKEKSKPRKNSDRQDKEPSAELRPERPPGDKGRRDRRHEGARYEDDERPLDQRRQGQERGKQPPRKNSERREHTESNVSAENKSEPRPDDKSRRGGDRERDSRKQKQDSNIPPRFQKLRGAGLNQGPSSYGPPALKPAFEKPKPAFDQQPFDKPQPQRKSNDRNDKSERKNSLNDKNDKNDAKVGVLASSLFALSAQGLADDFFKRNLSIR